MTITHYTSTCQASTSVNYMLQLKFFLDMYWTCQAGEIMKHIDTNFTRDDVNDLVQTACPYLLHHCKGGKCAIKTKNISGKIMMLN
jgi:hypothetical protein